MKIAICDDEREYAEQVARVISDYAENHPEKSITFEVFVNSADLLKTASETGGFDIYFLDIIMPLIDGIDLGLKLKESGFGGKIIYLTSSKEYALDSYKVKAFDYILKPVDKNNLFTVLDEVNKVLFNEDDKNIIVKTKGSSIKLPLSSIMYTELCRRVVVYHLTDGGFTESKMLRVPFSEAMQELLLDQRFVLCGKSMVVNLDLITSIKNDMIIFKDNFKVYQGVKACRELCSVWSDYWFNKGGLR